MPTTLSNTTLLQLAQQVGKALQQQGLQLVTAESCTGGGVAQAVTAIAGSSNWFERGFVTYSNASKCDLLGVQETTLASHGAVSEQTAQEMAQGALAHSHAQLSVAITGIAGPDGGDEAKPVGTVWIAWARQDQGCTTRLFHFPGDRATIRQHAIYEALNGLLALL